MKNAKRECWLLLFSLLVVTASSSCREGGDQRARSENGGSGAEARSGDGRESDARTVQIRMTPQGFSPNVLVLEYPPGRTVNVTVENQDSAPHGLRIRLGEQEFGLDRPVAAGATESFTFTMPAETRQGEFFSPVGDDRSRGFQGRAIPVVEAPGG